jgi:RNA polymerase sigma-70 factor, ECF subfamily
VPDSTQDRHLDDEKCSTQLKVHKLFAEFLDKYAVFDCLVDEAMKKHSQADTAKIELLYGQHSAALVLYGATIAGERGRAQDIVHEVFARLIEEGVAGHVLDIKAYLFACVRNGLRNETKRMQRNVELDQNINWFVPPERDFAAERQLRNALLVLNEKQREVIAMHIWGELTFSQIAEIIDTSANTVASRYRYALASLREVLQAKEYSL